MRRLLFALALPGSFVLAGTVGCYTVSFDEDLADVYYCQTDDDCGATQACLQFRCVDDDGPQISLTGPEQRQEFDFGTAEITANYSLQGFMVSDSNEKIEGQGKVQVHIMGTDVSTISVLAAGATLDVSALPPGAYRLEARAVYGDGTPYENPSASDYTTVFLEEENPERPQVAIVYPPPGYVHVVGEPLEVTVATRQFEFVESGESCDLEEDCDPWGPDAALCLPAECTFSEDGHAHIYTLDDYPNCLTNQVSCAGDYVLSLRPTTGIESTPVTATGTITADRFTEPGTYTFSAGLQYSDHDPYPTFGDSIVDQFTIEVIAR